MAHFMKKPCEHCPFRADVKPYLRPARGEELAYHASNPYNSFPCHKTTEVDEDSDCGERYAGAKSKECAGFLTLQIIENGEEFTPEGFTPAYDVVYSEIYEMVDAYENQDE